MDMQLKHTDNVYTKDGFYLGEAHCLYHRQGEVNPALEFYGSYLHVVSLKMGEDFYVPTDFLGNYDKENHRLNLTATLADVEHGTWERLPDFIVYGHATKEILPEPEPEEEGIETP